MIAYSAYGCLLLWATYVCYNDSSLRTSFCWAMTSLMLAKLCNTTAQQWTDGDTSTKMLTILVFYLPCYGGYGVYKAFFQ